MKRKKNQIINEFYGSYHNIIQKFCLLRKGNQLIKNVSLIIMNYN